MIKPMAHQKVSLVHDKKNPVIFDMSDAGTGKTGVRVLAFAERRKKGGGKALILGPKNLLKNAWVNDFKKFAPDMKTVIAPAGKRAEAFASAADAYITNHDAVKDLVKMPKATWADFDELIVDESTAFKHHSSGRSRALAKLSKHFKRRINLSATPNTNGICDIWHQMYILDGGKRLGSQFYAFRNSVCVPIQVGRMAQAVKWQDKDGAEEAVFGLIDDIVVRHKFGDCVDIPPTHIYSVEYELTKKARKTYDEMESTQLLRLGKVKMTAINAAAVMTKLLQVCSGAVYDNDGNYHLIETDRYAVITDMIEQRPHSLVFFQWKHQKEQLVKMAAARGITYCVLDGSASDAARTEMVTDYQAGQYRVMFAHPKSAAHGLTLTKGTSIIWAGPTYDLEWFSQGNKRQARIGQDKKTEVVVLVAKDTREEQVYEMLEGKNARMTNLLDLFA